MPKVKVEKIKVGDTVCTPGDRPGKTVCGVVHKVERDDGMVTFFSRDWATASQKKYSKDPMGVYFARKGESLMVKK